jgi:hypothetical protein
MPPRSPIIFWLLLAATLCVDAAAIVLLFADGRRRPESATLLLALAYAHVSLLCVRCVLHSPTNWRRGLLPFVAGSVAAAIIVVAVERGRGSESWEALLAFISLMWVHVASLLLLLWLLKPMRLFVVGVAADRSRWQFTTKHLFLLMTCLPILVIVFTNSAIVQSGVTMRGTLEFVGWVVGNVVLPVAIVAIVERGWLWIFQLAAGAVAALAVGMFLHWSVPNFSRQFPTLGFALLQAFALWVWLRTIRSQTPSNAPAGDPLKIPEVAGDALE